MKFRIRESAPLRAGPASETPKIGMMKTTKKENAVAPSGTDNLARRLTVTDLLDIMARLRGPGGCPWDREQTADTLKKYLIEEAYEVLEAIEAGTPEGLKEELGDLLLQIVFLSRIAEEQKQFNFLDVVHTLAEKLIRRHPHVFPLPDEDSTRIQAKTPGEVVKVWGAVKESEGKYAKRKSVLDGLPLSLPALERARRISARVARVGFDWPNIEGVWEKVQEELAELHKAGQGSSPEPVEEELGDLFFALVNWARFRSLSPEEALRKANRRFGQRFREVERELRRRGKTPKSSTLEEMDQIWNEAKKRSRGQR
jgi:tetrapyrrole methylase family protein/MazG family protein